MKKLVKRVSYYCPWTKEEILVAGDYPAEANDFDILDCIYTQGKFYWSPWDELWFNEESHGVMLPKYKVEVYETYIYIEGWFDRLIKWLRA